MGYAERQAVAGGCWALPEPAALPVLRAAPSPMQTPQESLRFLAQASV